MLHQDQAKNSRKTAVISHKSKRKSTLNEENSFDRRYEIAVKAFQNYMEGIHLVLKEKERKVLKVLRDRDSPLWFQELTDEQCATCDLILDEIRDDFDERTVHRSKALLRKLGVFPLCHDRIFRTAIILCNGNDISFLWILLELYYIRRPPSKATTDRAVAYSINERLLLSAIAHLDMITTLRGLDKILPPSKRPTGLPPKLPKGMGPSGNQPEKASLNVSPYRKRTTVKTTGYTVPLKLRTHRDEYLGRYLHYRNPEYIVRNEDSRWFARCGGSGRNLFSCDGHSWTSGESNESEYETDPSLPSADAVVQALLDEHIRSLISRVECCQLLCPKHHHLVEGRANLLQGLQRTTCVRDALMESVRAQCAQWKEEELLSDGRRHVECFLNNLVDEAVSLAILEPLSNCPDCRQRFDMQRKLLKNEKCVCFASDQASPMESASKEQINQNYFKFTDKAGAPFEVDYKQIFDDDQRPACPIKSAIHRALVDDRKKGEAGNIDIDRAIEKFVRKTWQSEREQDRERLAKAKDQVLHEPLEETDPLESDYIDTKDVSVLKNLLKRALRKLAQQPMYILATFPDADKLPILVAWIRDRYGVPISQQERSKALRESKFFWDTLIPRVTAIRWPCRKSTGLNNIVDWSYKAELESFVDKMMRQFHRRFKMVQVQEDRLWWTSMVAYHAGADRFRRTFSAYFPNCEPMMVPTKRPWRSHEYRTMTKR